DSLAQVSSLQINFGTRDAERKFQRLSIHQLPICQFASLPTCQFSNLPWEGEAPAEPKFQQIGRSVIGSVGVLSPTAVKLPSKRFW
ncbi:MAG: hypothetical protein ACK40X_12100, partial [Armatimonadota bacterium]